MTESSEPTYLAPYRDAAARHGGGFESLLWASRQTQTTRFEAIRQAWVLQGKSLLDVGCGRADLLDHLVARGVRPADYIGIEAVAALADVAAAKARACPIPLRVIRADFVREPARLFVGADVVTFSGSLNTMDDARFYTTLRSAYEAAGEAVIFNFLCSTVRAASPYLKWRAASDVIGFARTLSPHITLDHRYLDGDCTIAIVRPAE